MQNFAVFGNPINHSKSPDIHNHLFEKCKFDAKYDKVLVKSADEIKNYILSHNLNGANITVPFKEDIAKLCDRLEGIAKDVGAVNTILVDDGKLIGHNTDGDGFMLCVEEFGDIDSALLIGAGGASKSIAFALRDRGIDATIVNRSKNRLSFYDDAGFKTCIVSEIEVESYDLIINATSAGLSDDSLPIDKNTLEELFAYSFNVIDIVYGKMTSFLELAKKMDKPYKDGYDMLVLQALYASMIFADMPCSFEKRKEIMTSKDY